MLSSVPTTCKHDKGLRCRMCIRYPPLAIDPDRTPITAENHLTLKRGTRNPRTLPQTWSQTNQDWKLLFPEYDPDSEYYAPIFLPRPVVRRYSTGPDTWGEGFHWVEKPNSTYYFPEAHLDCPWYDPKDPIINHNVQCV
jgi:hypothetical protein